MTKTTVDQIFPEVFRKSLPFGIAVQPKTKVSQKLLAQVRDEAGGITCLRAGPQLAL
jgi:hypothetical protein